MQDKLIVNLSQEEEIRATVPDINYIPAYKVAEEERRANENERIANENERIEYYEELQRDVENGEYDGRNTVYVGIEEPTDEFYEVWIDPNGTPMVEAENIVMEDGETLQDKYENGELKGPKGDAGDVSFDDLKDYATKEYVENEIATFDFIKVVDALPKTGLENRIYFVPKADTQTQDLFDEYVWINDKWEWVTTKQLEVDLTPYYKKTETYSKAEINDKIVNTQSDSQTDTYSCDYINKYESSFAQMFTAQQVVIPAGKTSVDLEGVWGSIYDISIGDFYCDASNGRINIPAGSAEYIEVFGIVAGDLQFDVRLELYEENGTYAGCQTYHLTTYDGYKSIPIGNQIFKIPDTSKNYYVQCSIAHYKNEDATLNIGFSANGTYYGVKKIK